MHNIKKITSLFNFYSVAAGGIAVFLFIFFGAQFSSVQAVGGTYYLDGQLSQNCPGNYSVANRDCSGSDGIAWMDLDEYDVNKNMLSPGDKVIIRPGQYWKKPNGGLQTVSGAVGNPIVYTTLVGEERLAEICTQSGKCNYNPDPTCGPGGSGCPTGNRYYPTHAIAIGSNTEVYNLKIYGQGCLSGSNALLANSDIGGGGPSLCTVAANQGSVIAYYNTDASSAVRNNRIHWSTKGESTANSPCIMGYNGVLTIENNEIYDCYGAGIRFKDSSHAGVDEIAVVNKNFFTESTPAYLLAGGHDMTSAIGDCNQECFMDQVQITSNIINNIDTGFYATGGGPGKNPPLVANNTIVSSGEDGYVFGYWIGSSSSFFYNNLLYIDDSTLILNSFGDNHLWDNNCYWLSGGNVSWKTSGGTYRSLSEWQSTGRDINSVASVNPNFADISCHSSSPSANSCRPDNFKRTAYGESMTGSPYGLRCGAYQTGQETIGVDWNVIASNPSSPGVCSESWSCTSWSACVSGSQIRTCSDVNQCGTTVSRPVLSQSCTAGSVGSGIPEDGELASGSEGEGDTVQSDGAPLDTDGSASSEDPDSGIENTSGLDDSDNLSGSDGASGNKDVFLGEDIPALVEDGSENQLSLGNTEATEDHVRETIEREKRRVGIIDELLRNRLAGYIVLQVEEHGESWYIDPVSRLRHYLANGPTAYAVLERFGLGITNADLAQIPVGLEDRFTGVDSDNDGLLDKLEEGLGTDPTNSDSDGDGYSDGDEVRLGYSPLGSGLMVYDKSLVNRLSGRIVLQVEELGQAWYISPDDGKRYYMHDGEAAYQIMRFLSLGISNADIIGLPVGD